MKRLASLLIIALAVLSAGCGNKPQSSPAKVKYVFYMIGDGMGINQVTATEHYNKATGNGPEKINFFYFPVRGFVSTVSSSSLVTDSAAGGTALSSGIKTYNGAIGVDDDVNPVSSLTDWAKASGCGTGVITSVGINHATPASFMAHTETRRNYEDIALQYLDAPVDFAAGGGFITQRGTGHDAAYYEHKADSAGIAILRGKEAFADVESVKGRVLCLGNRLQSDLPYAIDREEGDVTLSDFVDAGIRYLEANFGDKGFFMMVEGGMIDYGGHGNDAAACFQELTDFAAAMDVVIAFKQKHPEETLIVVSADHETGGLMLGSGKYEMHPELLGYQKHSMPVLTALFRDTFFPEGKPYKAPSWNEVKAFFSRELGLWDKVEVSSKAEAQLRSVYDQTFGKGGNKNLGEANLYSVNSKLVYEAVIFQDKAAGYNWSYTSHSGSPVGLYADGPASVLPAFWALRDNTEIAPAIAAAAGYTK